MNVYKQEGDYRILIDLNGNYSPQFRKGKLFKKWVNLIPIRYPLTKSIYVVEEKTDASAWSKEVYSAETIIKFHKEYGAEHNVKYI